MISSFSKRYALLFICLVVSICSYANTGHYSVNNNKKIVQNSTKVWITKDFDGVKQFYTNDCKFHQQLNHENYDIAGITNWIKYIKEFQLKYPDYHETISFQLADGNKVVSVIDCYTSKVTWSGVVIDQLQQGKINESWAWFKRRTTDQSVSDQSRIIAIVKQAEKYITKNGIKNAIMNFRTANNLFIGNYNGMFYVSPLHPELIGKNQFSYKDPSGHLVVQEEINTAKSGGGWLKGRWRKDPSSGEYMCRRIYILPVAGNYFVGSWYHYPSNTPGDCVT